MMEMSFGFFKEKNFRILWHFLFWMAVMAFYTLFFGYQGEHYLQSLFFIVPLLVITIATTYFVNYFLFPRYLFRGKFKLLLLYSIYTFIVSIWLESLTIIGLVLLFVYRKGILLDQTAISFVFMVVGMYFIIIIAVGIKLLKLWYEKQNSVQVLAREKLEAELKLLKSQIHPHFLFNTINNIYALALKKSASAPEMILKLSSILDYLLYECDVPQVKLSKEIELIRNYTSLERIRYAERLDLDFKIEGGVDEIYLAPLILLPFVENSFKHGAGKKRDGVWIKMRLKVAEGRLEFVIENNKTKSGNEDAHGGIGLANVRKRLDLLYNEKYKLEILDEDEKYSIKLELNPA
ncbi:MAG: histidine kinase [Bacteroidales bacterium]